jgi:hypothetical protein
MSVVTAEDYLDSFRQNSGRIRGEGISGQIETLLARWQKVVGDCEDDSSEYRQQYASIHKQYVDWILYIQGRDSGMPGLYGIGIQDARATFDSAWSRIEEGDSSLAGVLDASAHILVELEKVFDV